MAEAPNQREEIAPKSVERRISLWASQAAANEQNSTITERRISMHLNRLSQQNLRATISQDDVVASGEPNASDKEELLKAEKPSPGHHDVEFTSEFHHEMYVLIESDVFEIFIMVIILLNTVLLMIATSETVMVRAGWYLGLLESVIIGVFLAETIIKLYVFRIRFFYRLWDVMDLIIITFNVIDLVLTILDIKAGTYGFTTIFRLLRILRSLRALHLLRLLRPFRFFSTLQVILVTIERSAIPMGIIAIMMAYVIYLFSVIGRGLYGELDYRFSGILRTMFTLYLMLTLDDWYFIPLAIEAKGVYHCFYFLFVYIFVNVFVFLDLFVAVICDNFQDAWVEEKESKRQRKLTHTGSFANMQEELEDHEDDDSLIDAIAPEDDEESDYGGDDDLNGQTIQEYYPEASEQDQQIMEQFFLVAAALENSCFKLLEMQHVLDMMVDVAADASDDAI